MNLIEALGGCEAEHAVCTTYPFEPLFFSNYAIDTLQEAGVATPVVLMDGTQYDQLAQRQQLTSRAIGQHYYLEPITIEQTFHPKVTFVAGESACHASVTSANLTLGEYTTAAQLGQTVTVPADADAGSDDVTPRARAVAQDVRGFVEQLAQEYVSGHDAKTEMQRAVQATEWLTERPSVESLTGGLVHNLKTPILEQVCNRIGEIRTATLFAPFFGSETTLSRIGEIIDASRYEILVTEGNTHLDPSAAVEAFGERVTFRLLDHDTARWIHAKGIVFEGSWGTAILYGSPNITGRALLETAATGNVEAGLLHYAPDEYSDSGLWEQAAFPASPGPDRDPSSFEFAEYATTLERTPTPSVVLTDARVEQAVDEEVVVQLAAPQIEEGTTVTIESLSGQTTDIVWTSQEDETRADASVRLPESWARSIVRLHISDEGWSNYRQITTEPTKGTRKVGEVLRNDGREGVQSLVDETLFLGVGIAPGALSTSMSRLSKKYEKQEEAADSPAESEPAADADNDDSDWTSGVKGVTRTERTPHLGVNDGMGYATERIESILDDFPTVAAAAELIDHLDNLWYYITRGLVRSALSSQLADGFDDDASFETTLNVERLHSLCVNQTTTLFESQFFLRIRDYIDAIRKIEPEATVEALTEEQLLDVFVCYPAIVLALMDWHDEVFVERFEFVRNYHTAMTVANPILGELLLDGQRATTRLAEHRAKLEDQLSALGDRIGRDLTLPGNLVPGLEILFYGFWYRELARSCDEDLFDTDPLFDQYDPVRLAEMARLALRGHDRVTEASDYAALTKGRFDPVVRLTEGQSDPRPQLQTLVERTDSHDW